MNKSADFEATRFQKYGVDFFNNSLFVLAVKVIKNQCVFQTKKVRLNRFHKVTLSTPEFEFKLFPNPDFASPSREPLMAIFPGSCHAAPPFFSYFH